MKHLSSVIKADYLRRTRSYAFLITLVITIYAAYSFVPPPTASYTTLSLKYYHGAYNSAWIGHVSAVMTSTLLSLFGFFLVHGGIKKDIDTGVGSIVATTSITNFGYLLSKMLSNFLILITISTVTLLISILMFFFRTSGYPLHVGDFTMPYLLFALPAFLTISSISIIFEVVFIHRTILQYTAFVFLFGLITAISHKQTNETLAIMADPFGLRMLTTSIKSTIKAIYHQNVNDISIGFTLNANKGTKTFEWDGVTWTSAFLYSRLLWIIFSFSVVYFSSLLFHRFDHKQSAAKRKLRVIAIGESDLPARTTPGRLTGLLPASTTDYKIEPLIKIELLLLIRQGNRWFWVINGGFWIAMLIAPLWISHLYLLPILWFLQVTRLSDLVTKEKTNRVHYFTYPSYKPLTRMFPAQIAAAVLLIIALALPLFLRYAIALDGYSILKLANGGLLVVSLSVCLGTISGSKKLYEIVFFLLTYAVVNGIQVTDYLGSMPHVNRLAYVANILMINIVLMALGLFTRAYQLRHL